MKPTRRESLWLGAFAGAAGAGSFAPVSAVAHGVHAGQPATFRNPVIPGDRPDPAILRDGDDYYATFSSFVYYPGAAIWHSRDLVNWRPVVAALTHRIGPVFAPDLAKHGGRYFIYLPVLSPPPPGAPPGPPFKLFVIHADAIEGPWSEPVDTGINGFIDPAHVTDDEGRRYLFLNEGHLVRLSADGLSAAGPVVQVYRGWPILDDYIVEGDFLEGPKLIRRKGWYYMFSAQGGTAGPPTSHMLIVARSRTLDGPCENCPHNPIVRTASRDEPWWSRGHATPVEDPDGNWWLAYHGYENGMRTLGRQMLLEPFEWNAEGWPVAKGGTLEDAFAKPLAAMSGTSQATVPSRPGLAALGHFLQFHDPGPDYLNRISVSEDSLSLSAIGTNPAESSPLALNTGDHAYEMSVECELSPGAHGGLLLFYDGNLFCGIGGEGTVLHTYALGAERRFPPPRQLSGQRFGLRVVNDRNVATFFLEDGDNGWEKMSSFEVSGYNHNIGQRYLSLRPAVFACGSGTVAFRKLRYRAL